MKRSCKIMLSSPNQVPEYDKAETNMLVVPNDQKSSLSSDDCSLVVCGPFFMKMRISRNASCIPGWPCLISLMASICLYNYDDEMKIIAVQVAKICDFHIFSDFDNKRMSEWNLYMREIHYLCPRVNILLSFAAKHDLRGIFHGT